MATPHLACVDIPALPLQLAQRSHTEWRGHPVVVVDQDSPRGIVLWANELARHHGILPGLRYAAGLSLHADLRATVVASAEIEALLDEVTGRLRCFSPFVEASPVGREPGLFFVDTSGLNLLYPALTTWATAVARALKNAQLICGLSVGYSRFGCYATARALAGRGQVVWRSAEEEAAAAARVSLHRTSLAPKARQSLAQLGIFSVGQFMQLPEAGLRRRFGAEAHRLWQLAAGSLTEPLVADIPLDPLRLHLDFDEPITDREALSFFVKQLLDPLLEKLAARSLALSEMVLTFDVDAGVDGSRGATSVPVEERLRPATPTLAALQLLGLVRLRLEHITLRAGVRGLSLAVSGRAATREQLTLFLSTHEHPPRDLAAGDRALARLRAALGDDAVVHAQLKEGHLPEAQFTWEKLGKLVAPSPRTIAEPPLVRRWYSQPQPASAPKHQSNMIGPFLVSGGWWNTEVRRAYYFAQSDDELTWMFYDQVRERWFLQGES